MHQQQQQQTDIDQQFVDLNKQMRELNMQYEDNMQREQEAQQEQHQQQHQPEYYEQSAKVQPSHEQTLSDSYASPLYYDPNAAQQQQQQQHLYDPSQQQLQPGAGYGHIETATEAYGSHNTQPYDAQPAATAGYDYWPGDGQQPFGEEVGGASAAAATVASRSS